MQNQVFIRKLFFCLLVIYLTLALETSPPVKRQISKQLTSETRMKRTSTQRPGFLKTLFSVIYEQFDDTRNISKSVRKMIDNNFLPDNPKNNVATTISPNSNVTTTEDTRISRSELQRILLRNLRGIQKLYRVELKEAMKQSQKTYDQFGANVTREILKFL